MVIFYCAVYMDTSFNIMKIASPNPDANEYEMSIKSKPIQSKKLIETSNALDGCMYPHIPTPTVCPPVNNHRQHRITESKTEKNTRPRLHVVW